MKHQQIYNLEEFANKYQLTDIFGAYAAYLSVGFTQPTGVDVLHHFKEMVQQRTLFTKLLLIRKGTATIVISEQDKSTYRSTHPSPDRVCIRHAPQCD